MSITPVGFAEAGLNLLYRIHGVRDRFLQLCMRVCGEKYERHHPTVMLLINVIISTKCTKCSIQISDACLRLKDLKAMPSVLYP